jgi:hypothetical protein
MLLLRHDHEGAIMIASVWLANTLEKKQITNPQKRLITRIVISI